MHDSARQHTSIDIHGLSDTRGKRRSSSLPNKNYSSQFITSKSIIDLSSHNTYIANNKLRQQCNSKSFTHQRSNNDSNIIITTDDNNILNNVVSAKDTTRSETTSKSMNHRSQKNDPNIITNKNNDTKNNVASLETTSKHLNHRSQNNDTNDNNDPIIIDNNDDDIVISNTPPVLESDSNKITRSSLTINDQSSTH